MVGVEEGDGKWVNLSTDLVVVGSWWLRRWGLPFCLFFRQNFLKRKNLMKISFSVLSGPPAFELENNYKLYIIPNY